MEGKEIFGTKYEENIMRSDCRLKTQGMSDLFMHEGVDISWDDFFLDDDRVVPHHGSKRLNDHFILGENNKRCRHEIVSIANNTGGKYVDHGKDKSGISPVSKTRNNMLVKDDVWSRKQNDLFTSGSENELTQESSSLVDDVNHTSNGIFGNVESKDSSDLLYSSWSEIENFDDIERMFRNDAALGVGVCKEDELSWLSSVDDVHALKSEATHDSYSCLENAVSNIHSDSHLSNPSSKSLVQSIVKSETSDLAPIFSRDSGHASSRMQYMDGFSGPPFNETCQGASSSSNMQESSTFDDISLEAASFRQLQRVTEQLDLRTKICIRDSLYRLAHSAEQRRSNSNPSSGFVDEREPSEAEATKSFMDMETDTNPIDRSVAHLLFNRPSDSSTTLGRKTSTNIGSV